jgi:hypothetical protein
MKLRTSVAVVAVVSFAGMGVAKADWLDDAWSETSSAEHGHPSITVGQGGVSIVLPRAVLDEAQAAGATAEGALRDFLGKYGPRLCSQLLDLNTAQKNLKVAMRVLEAPSQGFGAFFVSPVRTDFVLDYAPTNTVGCIIPGEDPVS